MRKFSLCIVVLLVLSTQLFCQDVSTSGFGSIGWQQIGETEYGFFLDIYFPKPNSQSGLWYGVNLASSGIEIIKEKYGNASIDFTVSNFSIELAYPLVKNNFFIGAGFGLERLAFTYSDGYGDDFETETIDSEWAFAFSPVAVGQIPIGKSWGVFGKVKYDMFTSDWGEIKDVVWQVGAAWYVY